MKYMSCWRGLFLAVSLKDELVSMVTALFGGRQEAQSERSSVPTRLAKRPIEAAS